MKTASEITEAVRDLCAAGLPPLFAAVLPTALPDFTEYLNKPPLRDTDSELCVYVENERDSTDLYSFSGIIQCQLYKKGKDLSQDYHSVIFPFLRENLTPELCGFEIRDYIEGDIWPADDRSTAYCFYAFKVMSELDDCDD